MIYFGKVENGKVILERCASLPEGARVRIELVNAADLPQPTAPDPADGLERFAVHTGIADLASQHDHYCSGAPKRQE
jgi:hypothetical protein